MRNYLSPMDLIARLDVAPKVEMEFGSETELERYRRLLYSINVQHQFRFSTRRVYNGRSGPTLQIIRLK